MKFIQVASVLTSLLMLITSGVTNAQPSPALDFCQPETRIEGSYLATKFFRALDTPDVERREIVRINIICVSENRLVASITTLYNIADYAQMANVGATNLGHFVADAQTNTLVLQSFPTDNDERSEFPPTAVISRLQLKIDSLRRGQIVGSLDGKNLPGFAVVKGWRDQTFPPMTDASDTPLGVSRFSGDYAVERSFLGPGRLRLNTVQETADITFTPQGTAEALPLVDGPKWTGGNTFNATTPLGHGGEPDERKLYAVRHLRVLGKQIEFYLIVPSVGLTGPFAGTRSKFFQGDILQLEDATPEERRQMEKLISGNATLNPQPKATLRKH